MRFQAVRYSEANSKRSRGSPRVILGIDGPDRLPFQKNLVSGYQGWHARRLGPEPVKRQRRAKLPDEKVKLVMCLNPEASLLQKTALHRFQILGEELTGAFLEEHRQPGEHLAVERCGAVSVYRSADGRV